MTKTHLLLFGTLLILLLLPTTFASLQLRDLSYDPAIISAGDEVDIVLQFEVSALSTDDKRVGNSDYSFRTWIELDDSISNEYVTILDAQGDDLFGSIYAGYTYNKKFRVKFSSSAPTANYEFKLIGQWYKGDVPDSETQYIRFYLPLKREGVSLHVANIVTNPVEIKPGFNYVSLSASFENSGDKQAQSLEAQLLLPQGFSASYSDNNRVWIGNVNKQEQKQATFSINIDQNVTPGVHNLTWKLSYTDENQNVYNKLLTTAIVVKPKPLLEVVSQKQIVYTAKKTQVEVVIKNVGDVDAESVDVRLIKQNTQPFVIDVRSDYIGELKPNEEGVALFTIETDTDANVKDYDMKVFIRAKGDTDTGDDTIYTYNRRAIISVEKSTSSYWTYGLIGIAVLIVGIVLLKPKKVRK